MKTHINKFGETITKWTSHKHPDNENFQQIVFWRITEKQCGRILVSYHLGDASYSKHLYNLTKSEALTLFVD